MSGRKIQNTYDEQSVTQVENAVNKLVGCILMQPACEIRTHYTYRLTNLKNALFSLSKRRAKVTQVRITDVIDSLDSYYESYSGVYEKDYLAEAYRAFSDIMSHMVFQHLERDDFRKKVEYLMTAYDCLSKAEQLNGDTRDIYIQRIEQLAESAMVVFTDFLKNYDQFNPDFDFLISLNKYKIVFHEILKKAISEKVSTALQHDEQFKIAECYYRIADCYYKKSRGSKGPDKVNCLREAYNAMINSWKRDKTSIDRSYFLGQCAEAYARIIKNTYVDEAQDIIEFTVEHLKELFEFLESQTERGRLFVETQRRLGFAYSTRAVIQMGQRNFRPAIRDFISASNLLIQFHDDIENVNSIKHMQINCYLRYAKSIEADLKISISDEERSEYIGRVENIYSEVLYLARQHNEPRMQAKVHRQLGDYYSDFCNNFERAMYEIKAAVDLHLFYYEKEKGAISEELHEQQVQAQEFEAGFQFPSAFLCYKQLYSALLATHHQERADSSLSQSDGAPSSSLSYNNGYDPRFMPPAKSSSASTQQGHSALVQRRDRSLGRRQRIERYAQPYPSTSRDSSQYGTGQYASADQSGSYYGEQTTLAHSQQRFW